MLDDTVCFAEDEVLTVPVNIPEIHEIVDDGAPLIESKKKRRETEGAYYVRGSSSIVLRSRSLYNLLLCFDLGITVQGARDDGQRMSVSLEQVPLTASTTGRAATFESGTRRLFTRDTDEPSAATTEPRPGSESPERARKGEEERMEEHGPEEIEQTRRELVLRLRLPNTYRMPLYSTCVRLAEHWSSLAIDCRETRFRAAKVNCS